MIQRCTNEKNPSWDRYGGAGVRVCERWFVFANFLADMGERPEGTTIDRIDSSGNYEPGNCRWAPQEVQVRNKRTRRGNKLTAGLARQIRWLAEIGYPQRKIARMYDLSESGTSAVVRGLIWNE